ncbi:MAG TPA: sigma-70 family RNA polymerase sigma factor [Mycobacteriales bacterium]
MVRTARPARDVAAEADLLAVAAPVRRAVTARLINRPELDPDDVVQETLTRVWAERWRLERSTLLAYALVVARNLVTSAERREDVGRRHRHRLAEPPPDGDPAPALVAAEEEAAVARAVAALRDEDRSLLLDHEVHGVEARKIAAEQGVGAATVAARLARARARLRVAYLLEFRRTTLPTPRCRGVLEAVSLGDRSRQRSLHAAEHLLDCPTCAALAEPLLTRRRSLTALAPVALLLALPGRLVAWIRGNPLPAAATGAGAAAAVAVAVVVLTGSPPPTPVAAPAPTPARSTTAPATLRVGTAVVLPAARLGSMAGDAGRTAEADDVPVQSVPADEGFWVGGGPGARVWVQLKTGGRESPVRVRPGQRASFAAEVVRVTGDSPARIGLTDPAAVAELRAVGAYLVVDPARLRLRD